MSKRPAVRKAPDVVTTKARIALCSAVAFGCWGASSEPATAQEYPALAPVHIEADSRLSGPLIELRSTQPPARLRGTLRGRDLDLAVKLEAKGACIQAIFLEDAGGARLPPLKVEGKKSLLSALPIGISVGVGVGAGSTNTSAPQPAGHRGRSPVANQAPSGGSTNAGGGAGVGVGLPLSVLSTDGCRREAHASFAFPEAQPALERWRGVVVIADAKGGESLQTSFQLVERDGKVSGP
jgi:hypothetical protein